MTKNEGFSHLAAVEQRPEVRLLAEADVDRVAGLVFELAAQLHSERHQRMALEELLVRNGIVTRVELAALAKEEAFHDRVRAELSRTQQSLFDVLLESDDARAPLRTATPAER